MYFSKIVILLLTQVSAVDAV